MDRDLLRELLGQEELRDLIDPGALVQVEEDLQHRSPRTQATGGDELCEVLRSVGDLRDEELAERVLAGLDAPALLASLERERRVVRLRIRGQQRIIAADDAGLYRDAFGASPPGGLPAAFIADVPDALTKVVARYARTHGPFTTGELRERYGLDVAAVLREQEHSGELVQGELRPGGSEREWCHVEVLRRLRRASLAALRKEIEPVDTRALSAFMPSWQGVDRWRPGSPARGAVGGAGVERLREVLIPLQGLALPVAAWERDVLPVRCGSYSPAWLDSLCAAGELVWVGAGSLARDSGRVALYFREDALILGPPTLAGRSASAAGGRVEPPAEPEHDLLRARLRASPCFFADLLAEVELPVASLTQALWDLVWAGEVTNDAWAPLRAPRVPLAPQLAASSRPRTVGGRCRTALRWRFAALWASRHGRPGPGPLVSDLLDLRRGGRSRWAARPKSPAPDGLTAQRCKRSIRASAAALLPSSCWSATGCSLASRCSPRASPAASPACTALWANWRPWGCAVAATSWRASAAPSSPCPARSSVCAQDARPRRTAPRSWRRWTPPNRSEPRCRGPAVRTASAGPRVWPVPMSCSWTPGPCSTWSGAGAGSSRLDLARSPLCVVALACAGRAVRSGGVDAIALERVDGEPAIGSCAGARFGGVGFSPGSA